MTLNPEAMNDDEKTREQLMTELHAVRQSEDRFRKLADLLPQIVFETDQEGRLTYANRYAYTMFRMPEDTGIIGLNTLDLYIPEDRPRALENVRNRIAGSSVAQNTEYTMIRHDGTTFNVLVYSSPVMEGGRPAGLRGIIVDITERKQLEDARAFLLDCGNEDKDEDFFESLASYLAKTLEMEYVCIDRLEGDGLTAQTVAIFNDGVFDPNVSYALRDTPCGDVVGKTICCFPENVCRLFPFDAALQELRAVSYVGTTLWGFDARPIGLIAVIGRKPLKKSTFAEALLNLVSDRAASELQRRKVQEQLRMKNDELEKLNAEKDKFFSIMAHDLRSPFNTLLGLSNLLVDDLPDLTNEEIGKYARTLKDSAGNLFALLENLLEWSCLQRGMTRLEPVEIRLRKRITLLVAAFLNQAEKKGITMSIEVPEDIIVFADDHMFGSIVRNLLSNAVKFTHSQGTVHVSGRRGPGNSCEIIISDNGIGMTPEMLRDLFLFERNTGREGTAHEPSTGLGLIICKDLIEKNGGKLYVESAIYQGSSFSFTLPGPIA